MRLKKKKNGAEKERGNVKTWSIVRGSEADTGFLEAITLIYYNYENITIISI